MKTKTWMECWSVGVLLALMALSAIGQTNEKLSQLPVTNVMNAGDDFIDNATNGGGPGLYKTFRINFANVLNSPFFLGGNYLWTGNQTWTNPPQTIKPLQVYSSNSPINITAQSAYITGPSGMFANWKRGMTLYAGPGNNDQYTVIAVLSATKIEVTPVGGHNETGQTGWLFSSHALQITDINGGDFGFNVDAGGNIGLGDASGSGGNAPAINWTSPALNPWDGGMLDLVSVPGYGVITGIGGNQGEGSACRWALYVSTMAPQFANGTWTNGLWDQEVGRTNVNNGNGGGTLDDFGLVIDHYGLEALATNVITAPGTITITSAGHVTGVGTAFTHTFLNCRRFFCNGTEYHINFTGSDTSAFVWENTSQVAGSSYTLAPDAIAAYDNNGTSVDLGTHLDGDEFSLYANVPSINLNGGASMFYLRVSAPGNFVIGNNVTGTGGAVNQDTFLIQPNAPFNSQVIQSNGTAEFKFGVGSLAVNVGINVSGGSTTNTTTNSMKEFLTGAPVTFTNYNNAGTPYLTNTIVGTNVFVDILQPGGITSNSAGATGHLNPF